MPTIFDGVSKMTDDEIRMQIALLRNVTMMNVAKETGKKLIGGLAGLANAFTEAFSNKTPFNYQAERVSDMVKEAMVQLKANDRIQLEYELKKTLIEKCRELSDTEMAEELDKDVRELSGERLSFIICNEAAKAYPVIEKYKTPANKLEEVSIQYNKNFLASLHSILIGQNVQEVKATDLRIQQRLNDVSMETKRSLQKALMPKEFSGYGIGRILRLERNTKYLEFTVTYLGADCFDIINVSAATAFTAVKNLKRVSRMLLAQFVWSARKSYGDIFTIDTQLLPSYVSMNNYNEHMEAEKEFRTVIAGRVEADRKLQELEKDMEKLNAQLDDAKDRYELEQRDCDEIHMQFMGLESRKDEYMSGKKPEEETKSYYGQVNETKRKMDRADAELAKKRSRMNEIKSKLEKK